MRRTVTVSLLALATTLSASGCSTVNDRDVVARVNGHELTFDQLDELAGGTTDGASLRSAVSTWVQVGAVVPSDVTIDTEAALNSASGDALNALVGQYAEGGKASYAKGFDGAELLCLAAIPLEASVDADAVLAEIAGGTSFADAAAEYSANADYAATGGVIYDQQGRNCMDPDTFASVFSIIIEPLQAAAPVPGEVVLIEYGDSTPKARAIAMLRPYDSLTIDEQAQLSRDEISAALQALYADAEVYVNPRVGRWDVVTATVVADEG